MSITGWGYDEILYEVPFAAGLQMIHADDWNKGNKRSWTHNKRIAVIDTLTEIERAFAQ